MMVVGKTWGRKGENPVVHRTKEKAWGKEGVVHKISTRNTELSTVLVNQEMGKTRTYPQLIHTSDIVR
jgi:hypothetical protein